MQTRITTTGRESYRIHINSHSRAASRTSVKVYGRLMESAWLGGREIEIAGERREVRGRLCRPLTISAGAECSTMIVWRTIDVVNGLRSKLNSVSDGSSRAPAEYKLTEHGQRDDPCHIYSILVVYIYGCANMCLSYKPATVSMGVLK